MKEASEKELEEFVQLLTSAKSKPPSSRPPKCSWLSEEKIERKIECLEAYAVDTFTTDEQRQTAGMVICTISDMN